MLVLSVLTLSAAGGLALIGSRVRRQRVRPLGIQLASSQQHPSDTAHVPLCQHEQGGFSTNEHLALSAGLLAMTTVARMGMPLLSVLSLPGLLYLDGYFVYRSYCHWQEARTFGIEINNAILVTGLAATGQLTAVALFATFFFTGRELAERGVAASSTAAETASRPNSESSPIRQKAQWQQWIDRSALPVLTLSVVSIPFLGITRALGVLIANFSYDYQVLAPLSALSQLRTARAEGIWLRDARVFERVQGTSILLVEGDLVFAPEMLDDTLPMSRIVVQHVDTDSAAAHIAAWQRRGHTVTYVSATLENVAALNQADVAISYAPELADPTGVPPHIHVVLSSDQAAQIVRIFTLAATLDRTQKRGIVLAIVPSFINLGGIYFWQFDPVTALLVDYSGFGLGVLNALWPL